VHRPGTLFAAGLITGEALMGIAIAIPIVMTERADVLRSRSSSTSGNSWAWSCWPSSAG
jgi:hypothetical protein